MVGLRSDVSTDHKDDDATKPAPNSTQRMLPAHGTTHNRTKLMLVEVASGGFLVKNVSKGSRPYLRAERSAGKFSAEDGKYE